MAVGLQHLLGHSHAAFDVCHVYTMCDIENATVRPYDVQMCVCESMTIV